MITETNHVCIKIQKGNYVDSIRFANQAERNTWTDEMIEAECERRYINWLDVINAPPSEAIAMPNEESIEGML